MGALVAAYCKKGISISDKVVTMMETLRHRGPSSFGLASFDKTETKKTLDGLRRIDIESDILIGYNLAKILPKDKAQPIQSHDLALVFDGRLFPPPSKCEAEFLTNQFLSSGNKPMDIIKKLNGAYAFAIVKDKEILLGRDLVGTIPLYFGENEIMCAAASERKALWKIGITKTEAFPPGRLAVVSQKGFRFKTIRTIAKPVPREFNMNAAVQQLEAVLSQSAEEHIEDAMYANVGTAVAFSGGIDSAMVAFLLELLNVKTKLICVALENMDETLYAEKAASELGLPLSITTYSIDDLDEILPKVLWAIEECNPVSASIAVALYWAAQRTAKLGSKILLSGQGADELFGGYHRYLKDYARLGSAGLHTKMYQDVIRSFKSNFQRDNKVCAFHNVEPRLIFADHRVIQYGLNFPPELKIASLNDALRKRVLRKTAEKLGIPKLIVERPKKAVQYSTGVTQAIRRLARRSSLTLREYLKNAFRKGCNS